MIQLLELLWVAIFTLLTMYGTLVIISLFLLVIIHYILHPLELLNIKKEK